MHRLAQFAVGTITPEWQKLLRNQPRPNESEVPMSILLLIESYLWLCLGVELGAFPRKESFEVYDYYYVSFFDWLKMYGEMTRQSPSGRPFFETSFYLGLPEFARILVRKGLEGARPFEEQPSGVGERPELVTSFQALLILYSLLCRDAAVRQFVYAIGFVSRDQWERQWNRACTAEEVSNALQAQESPPVAVILAGYLKLCQYAGNTNEVLENIDGLRILDQARLFEFKDRIANMQSWRLSLSSRDSARRFEQIRTSISEMMKKELTELGLPQDVQRIQQSLDRSLQLFVEPVYV